MWNLIKAQNYQIKKSNLTYITFLIGIAMAFLPLTELTSGGLENTSGGLYALSFLAIIPLVFIIFSILLGSKIFAGDMADKTINYELLSGHSREEVFFSRCILAFGWGLLGSIIITVLPLILMGLILGWGKEVILEEFICRYLLILLCAVRYLSEIILIAVIVRNSIISSVLGYVLIGISTILAMLLEEFLGTKPGHIFVGYEIEELGAVSNSQLLIVDGEKIRQYMLTLDSRFIAGSITTNVVAVIVFLLLSYVMFRKWDMK